MNRFMNIGGWVLAALVSVSACKKDEKADGKSEAASASAAPESQKVTDNTAAKLDPAQAAKPSVQEMVSKCWGAFNDKDLETFHGCYADDAVVENVGMPPMQGKEAFAAMNKTWMDAMSMTGVPEITLVNGNNLVILASTTGKNTGAAPMMGIPEATNKDISGFGIQRMTLNDDMKVATSRDFWDNGVLMGQLAGAVPSSHEPWNLNTHVESKGDEAEKALTDAIHGAIGALGKGELETFLGAFHDEYEGFMNGMPVTKGVEGKKQFMQAFGAAFPDIQFEIKDVWAAGDYAYLELGWKATNKGAMPPLIAEATNKTVDMSHAEIIKLEDGKVRQQWIVMNTGALLMQLGLVPEPKAPEAAPAK